MTTTFKTKIFVTTPNVETVHIVSPKTGKSIHIYSGWFSVIPADIAKKLWDAWNAYNQAARAYKEAHPEDVWARGHYTRKNDCFVELTVAELIALNDVFQGQQKKMAAGSPNRNRNSRYEGRYTTGRTPNNRRGRR